MGAADGALVVGTGVGRGDRAPAAQYADAGRHEPTEAHGASDLRGEPDVDGGGRDYVDRPRPRVAAAPRNVA